MARPDDLDIISRSWSWRLLPKSVAGLHHIDADADPDHAFACYWMRIWIPFHFDPTDPTFHFNTDPDPTFQFDADPDLDLQHCS